MFNKKIFLLIGIFLLVFTPTVIALRVNFGAEVGEFTINTWTNLTELNQMEDLFNSLFSAKTTDDLTQGSSNLYDDTDWNKTYADTLYSTIDEPLWTANFTAYNSSWSSTYNASYVPYTGATQNVDLGANNLSVDGSTLFVDTSTNRVGIGTATPNKEIHIFKDASTSVGIRMENKDTTNGGVLIGFDNGEDMFLYNYGIRGINFGTRGLERMRIAHDGNVGIGTSTPQNTLNVLGDFNQTGGNSTIDMIYAEAWGKDIGDVIISDANVYYPITNLTQGLINGMSGNNENLTVIFDGVYKIVAHWSFSGTANNEYHISIDVNGVQQDKCHAERKIGTGGDVGSASFTCLYDFNIGDKVRMVIENADAGNDATIHSINTNMVRIGN